VTRARVRFAIIAFSAASYFLRFLMITNEAQKSQFADLRLLRFVGVVARNTAVPVNSPLPFCDNLPT
jgi:hypothetical protein